MSDAKPRVVVVTRKTRLAQLIERFNTLGQAKFYIVNAGGDFAAYVREDDHYRRALDTVSRAVELGLQTHAISREIVPTYLFGPRDVIVTVGQDGLVANVAKYVGERSLVAVNPDPEQFDGVLLPFLPDQTRAAVVSVLERRARHRAVTLAEATLADGQRLLAFNDLFVGARGHVSARYTVFVDGQREAQSSSGVLIATGAGSTGWLSSTFHMATAIARLAGARVTIAPPALGWDDPRLAYVVREPFASRHSGVSLTAGLIAAGQSIELVSEMPTGGVVFSDGVEADALSFNSGARATIRAAVQRAQLVVPAR